MEVIVRATIIDQLQLNDILKEEIASGVLIQRDGGLLASDALASKGLPESATFLTPLLESLLRYIEEHSELEKGICQVKGAIVLAKTVLTQAPHLAARVYDVLDHPMKAIGDKSLVRDVAEMCISAASKRQHDREAAECIARARICGFSWVYQRTNELDLAQDEATKSLELGQKLGYSRNDAFCLKCLGRLLRMRAEQATSKADRERFVAESIDKLRQAIQLFGKLHDFGEFHSQVGDCFSLLGRTYLVTGDLARAHDAATEAQKRITDDASKAFLDLQILLGDLAMKLGRGSPADYYSTVIAQKNVGVTDYEKSEIVARALLQRGIAKKSTDKAAAERDFEAATKIWNDLGEEYFAFEARWQAIKLQEDIPTRTLQEIEKDRPEIRVRAYEWINERLKNKSRHVVAQRRAHDLVTWRQALKATRERVALEKYR